MIGRTRVGFKFFFWGLVAGVLFAPRSGKETRAKVWSKIGSLFDTVLKLV